MSSSTRYFQLTPDILVEYKYSNLNTINETAGDVSDTHLDLTNNAGIVHNNINSTNTLLLNQLEDRFVLPVNKSESKFIKWDSSNINFSVDSFTEEGDNQDNDDILIDSFRLHFTSRNYFGSYDGLIISVYLYDKLKNKIGLMSYHIEKTDDPRLNHTPVLINQKLYTTYQDFTLPNVVAIVRSNELSDSLPGEGLLKSKLSLGYEFMENTPVVMNIYGVKSSYINNNVTYYNTEKINTIFIPLEDKSNQLEIKIEEAVDGDYFKIYPIVDNNLVSFSDYIYKISDGHPEKYIVFYELTLTEHCGISGEEETVIDKTTHREQYIINAAKHSDEEEGKFKTNEGELDDIMYYRPIVINNKVISITIDVNANIINTYDNTTIVKHASLDSGDSESGFNPKKYGKKMNKIYLGDIPAQINVYNKKPDIDRDGVKIINSSSNVKIENHQHSVIGFVECTNVGVSIEQIPKELL